MDIKVLELTATVEESMRALDKARAELAAERAAREKAERQDAQWRRHAEQSDIIVREACAAKMAAQSRAEQAERDRDTWRQACAQVEARAEQAERERAEMNDRARRNDARAVEAIAARERAEADTAALLEAYRRTWSVVQHDNVLHSPACNARADTHGDCTPECPALYVSTLLKAAHPGAAMLERMRALEKAATQASAELRHTFRLETRDWNLVARAIRILEAATTPNASAAAALRGEA